MLILFDVDLTLISTSRAGMWAMREAARELFGAAFEVDGVEFAGRLDALISADILRAGGLRPSAAELAAFRARYLHHIRLRLAEPGCIATMLPGVPALLAALREDGRARLGLLTGNFEETGREKLRACGLDADEFDLHVWSDDATSTPPTRDDLPAVALQRHRARFDPTLAADRAVIVGDTPHDVQCALANGLRCLGVATGPYSTEALMAAGAHHAVPDLRDTSGVLRWLLNDRA